jgi:predicted aspartyl protease
MKFKSSGPPVVFCRLKGRNGRVREVQAVVEPGYEYCCMLRNDAAQLGYPSVTFRTEDWADTNPEEVVNVVSVLGIETGTMIKLAEVSVGRMKVKEVDTIVKKAEFPITTPVSMFLGRSFLKHFDFAVERGGKSFSLSAKK